MAVIADRDRAIIKSRFDKDLVGTVELIYFTQGESGLLMPGQPCPTCREQQSLLEELAALSPKLHLAVHDFVAETDRPAVADYRIAEIPALVITADGRKGVRYFGLTSGYEFAALLEDIIDVSRGTTALLPETKEALAKLSSPVHLRVFVTPT